MTRRIPPEKSRLIVLEHTILAGNPLIPADSAFVPENVEASDGSLIAARYPRIGARLVVPVSTEGGLPRADKVFDVHYHLLGLAALSEYEDRYVRYTQWGLIRDMGWTHGGRQTRLVRHCVDYLFSSYLELEGALPDPVMPGQISEGVNQFRIIITRGFPKEEARRGGGRNLSFVEYHPAYLESIRNSPGVQIDVEMLSQISGSLGKAFYRLASFLRSAGETSIDLAEAFERVGSSRKRITPSEASAAFGSAWDAMRRYRHIRQLPEIIPNGRGGFTLHLDWDDPVALPHKGDMLFRMLTEHGVEARVAEGMIREDRRRVGRLLQAFRQGALPPPTDTVARLLVGAFRHPSWDFQTPSVEDDEQTSLLAELSSGAWGGVRRSQEPAEAPAAAPPPSAPGGAAGQGTSVDHLLDWTRVRSAPGGWDSFWSGVLCPLLRGVGDANPEAVLQVDALVSGFTHALQTLGWAGTVDVAYRSAPYMADADKPASYLLAVLQKETGGARPAAPAPPAAGAGEKKGARKRTASREEPGSPAAQPKRGRGTGGPREKASVSPVLAGELARTVLRDTLESWLAELRQPKHRNVHRKAAEFLDKLSPEGLDETSARLVTEIRAMLKESGVPESA